MVSAFEKALSEHTDTALKASTEAPDWFVLEVCFPEECIAKAFPQSLLHWNSNIQQLEWHGVLSLRNESVPGVFLRLPDSCDFGEQVSCGLNY